MLDNLDASALELVFEGNVKPRPAPNLVFPTEIVDFGDIKKGKTAKKKIYIQNTGKRVLIIHEISHHPQLMIEIKKIKLESGEKSLMTIKLKPYFRERKQYTLKFRINSRYKRYRYLRIKYNSL